MWAKKKKSNGTKGKKKKGGAKQNPIYTIGMDTIQGGLFALADKPAFELVRRINCTLAANHCVTDCMPISAVLDEVCPLILTCK